MSDNGSAVRYVPGHAVLLCHGPRAVMLRLVADHGLVGEAWARLEQDASIDQVLELILGEGLRTVSEFALLERSGGSVRLILRGEIDAEVRRGEQVEPIATEGIWVDKRLDGDGVLVLSIDGARDDAAQLPLAGGIVLAERALVPLSDDSAHDEAVIAAPAEATDAQAESLAEQPEVAGQPEEAAVTPDDGQVSESSQMSAAPSVYHDGGFGAAAAGAGVGMAAGAGAGMMLGHDAEPQPADPRLPEAGQRPEQATEISAGDEAAPAGPGAGGYAPPPMGGFGAPAAPAADETGGRMAQDDAAAPRWDESAQDTPQVDFEPERPAAVEDPFGETAAFPADRGEDEPAATQMTPAQEAGPAPAAGTGQYHGPVMILPDGQEVELSGPAVVGRAPKAPDGFPAEVRLVTMNDPDRDVSSTHLAAQFDGQRVMVTDLGSTNGTDLCVPGQPVRLLQAHQATELTPGSHLMLAGSQKVTFEAR